MIDKETKDELVALAQAQGVSMAKIVRKLVKDGLKKDRADKKKTVGNFLSLLVENAGRSKGKRDLARNHDYYLYGPGRIK